MFTYDKPDNLVELVESSIARHPDNAWFGTKTEHGRYRWVTYDQVGQRIDRLRAGLAQLGVAPGDAVGLIANNSVAWATAAFATFGLRARFIPMYEKELVSVWEHIIDDGQIKVLFVANADVAEKVAAFRDRMPHLKQVLTIAGDGPDTMAALESKGARSPVPSQQPTPQEIAVLIYTSGTTGKPKGVLLSHGNFTSNVIAGSAVVPQLNQNSRSLSILPWAHSYGQTAELYTFTYLGASIGFAEDVTTIADDLAKVSPTFLIAVPRVFNKIYDGLQSKMTAAGGLAKRLFDMGLTSAAQIRKRRAAGQGSGWPGVKYKIADAVVFKKIRQRFGGRLQGALTASAMMNLEVAQFFHDIGLPVFDCYGLTETSPAVSMSGPGRYRPGSVGRPIDKVTVKIDTALGTPGTGDGEIIVYGPNVMQGYHNRPEATAEVMTADGGFRTGDQGRLDADGYLFITGRIKEQYKLENGKYVFPVSLEEEIRLVPWVENAMVYGEGRAFNVCLIVPDFLRLAEWIKANHKPSDPCALVTDPDLNNLITTAINAHLAGKFGGYEIPRQYVLIPDNFCVENGMLTQTLKLKRRRVIDAYNDQILSAYTANS